MFAPGFFAAVFQEFLRHDNVGRCESHDTGLRTPAQHLFRGYGDFVLVFRKNDFRSGTDAEAPAEFGWDYDAANVVQLGGELAHGLSLLETIIPVRARPGRTDGVP